MLVIMKVNCNDEGIKKAVEIIEHKKSVQLYKTICQIHQVRKKLR